MSRAEPKTCSFELCRTCGLCARTSKALNFQPLLSAPVIILIKFIQTKCCFVQYYYELMLRKKKRNEAADGTERRLRDGGLFFSEVQLHVTAQAQ